MISLYLNSFCQLSFLSPGLAFYNQMRQSDKFSSRKRVCHEVFNIRKRFVARISSVLQGFKAFPPDGEMKSCMGEAIWIPSWNFHHVFFILHLTAGLVIIWSPFLPWIRRSPHCDLRCRFLTWENFKATRYILCYWYSSLLASKFGYMFLYQCKCALLFNDLYFRFNCFHLSLL